MLRKNDNAPEDPETTHVHKLLTTLLNPHDAFVLVFGPSPQPSILNPDWVLHYYPRPRPQARNAQTLTRSCSLDAKAMLRPAPAAAELEPPNK